MQLKNVTIYTGDIVGNTLTMQDTAISILKKDLSSIQGITFLENDPKNKIERADIILTEVSTTPSEKFFFVLREYKIPTVVFIKDRDLFALVRTMFKNCSHVSTIQYNQTPSERIFGLHTLIEYVRRYKLLKNP